MSILRKLLIGFVAVVALAAIAGLVMTWRAGAWNLVFPSDHADTVPPEIAEDFGRDAERRVLVYSKTNSFRHREAIPAAHALIDDLGAERGWAVFHTENSAVFDPSLLARFDTVVFANASGNHASDEQDQALKQWLEGGGGWVGIHAAGDDSHSEWNWYIDTLIGGLFVGHIMGPQFQEARVVVESTNHPVTRGVPAEFRHEEEWYSWDRSARDAGFEVLLVVDESSYEPWIRFAGNEVDIRMKDHPIAWTTCVGRGRAVYTAMGHSGATYEAGYMKSLVENSIEWTSKSGAEGCVSSSGSVASR